MPRPRVHIDYETFSDVNLITCGETVYSHRAVPLLLGWQIDDGKTELEDYADNFNEGINEFGDFDPDYSPDPPEWWAEAIRDRWTMVAHNYLFEHMVTRNSPATAHWPKPRIEQWVCTAAKARYWGLPTSLEKAGRVLNLDIQKDKRGHALIQKFCVPQKAGGPRSKEKFIRRIDPTSQDWGDFRRYCLFDVKTEYGIDNALPDIPAKYAQSFFVDGRMNERGFPVDIEGVKRAQRVYDHFYDRMEKRFKELSKGLKPTQVAKIKEAVNELVAANAEDGYVRNPDAEDEETPVAVPARFDDLRAATIRDALLEDGLPPEAREMLEIRAEAAKASIKKLEAFLKRTTKHLRAHGGFLWYGAHTGRWSGKGIQPQNFPRGIEVASFVTPFFRLLERLCLTTAELVYPNPLAVLAAALRGFIKAPKGKRFYVVDYAQIELRVLAWLAGAQTILDDLRAGLDPYSQFAGKHMYNRDPATIDKKSIERQIAKSALLGAQYQIWIDAFIEYCKVTAGIKITREQSTLAITAYREANPEIVEFWGDAEKAFIHAIESQGEARLNNIIIRFEVIQGREWVRVYLPSGRPISYYEPQVRMRVTTHQRKDRFTGEPLFDEVTGEPLTYEKKKKVASYLTEFQGKTIREYTYGGKLTENWTQGIAADIMSVGMINAEEDGFPPIMTVHDEVVTEVDDVDEDDHSRESNVHLLEQLVCNLPPCYDGLPIAAEGFHCTRYRKG